MADEKIITSSVFEQGITEIMQDIANNLYEFEEYTEEEVADLMDLSEEEVAELTRVINDTTVALNKVYSNKKVEDLLSELEVTCNKYADEKIGGLANIHLAYVDVLPTTGEDNVIYILKSTTGGNDTLNLYNNGWVSIGEFAVRLDNHYDKNQIDTLLNDKANKNEVFSQDDVVNDMSNVSSSTVLSTAGLEVELNKKANLDDMTTELDKKVDKDSIATILDNSVTDEQLASAKAIYNKSKNKITSLSKGEDIIAYADSISNEMVMDTVRIMNGINSPYGVNTSNDFYYTIYNLVDDNYKRIVAYNIRRNDMYMIMKNQGVWGTWQRVCTTTVADVSKTRMTFSNETYCKPINAEEGVVYEVKNGICFVHVKITNTLTSTNLQYKTFCTGLPKPSVSIGFSAIDRDFKGSGANFVLTLDGELQILCADTTNIGKYYTIFSYPVAE